MTPFWEAPAVLVLFMSWMNTPAASLAEAGHKESLRRQLAGKSASSVSNDNLPEWAQYVTAPPPETAAPPATETQVPPPAAAAAPAPAAQTPPRDEQWWRDRIGSARSSLERNQVLSDAMQARINGLQTDVVNRDDPAQRSELRRQLQRALDEMDRLKQLMVRDQQSIKDIQTEARRNGIPPGWVR